MTVPRAPVQTPAQKSPTDQNSTPFQTKKRETDAQDAVIAIPPYFGQTHRYALYDAADIAGLNILAEVSDLSAAALQWGIDKEFTPEGTWTVVYDMGATSAGAALVRYSTFDGKEGGKKKTHGQFEIKAVAWDEACGGEDMDMVLVDHFAAEFDAARAPSAPALSSPRAVSKLRKQARKTKEILSANKEAPISVEGMHEDHDFRSSIKRSEFEKLAEAAGIKACATAPLRAVLERLPEHGVTLGDIEVVEIIGGATRVPFIKQALSDALGGRALDTHLDADEAVAMGAGLFAANMSTTFRMRKFGAADARRRLDRTARHPGVRSPSCTAFVAAWSTPSHRRSAVYPTSGSASAPGDPGEAADFDAGRAEAMRNTTARWEPQRALRPRHPLRGQGGVRWRFRLVEVRRSPEEGEEDQKGRGRRRTRRPADPERRGKDKAAGAAEAETEPSEAG